MKHGFKKLFNIVYLAISVFLIIESASGADDKLMVIVPTVTVCGLFYIILRILPSLFRLDRRAEQEVNEHFARRRAEYAKELYASRQREAAAAARRRAEDEARENRRKAYARYQAKNDIVYHRTKAQQYQGTRDGARHERQMWDAIKRSKQY
jgi:hypothetical protein